MANITAQMVKELREKTGAGMMDCKAALNETGGDMEAAVDWLRKKGLAKAATFPLQLTLTPTGQDYDTASIGQILHGGDH